MLKFLSKKKMIKNKKEKEEKKKASKELKLFYLIQLKII